MSSSIDERIVAMHFNNADFEKNARQSIKTLQELREGLNLEGAAEGFAQISKATSESLGLKETTRQAGLFTRSLSTMGKMAKGVFSAATFPLKAIGNTLSTLGKYTGTVFGFDLANQIVSTGKNLIRAFTIDPVKSGWQEYNLLIDSTKTILTGTLKSYTEAQKKLNPNYVYDEGEHLAYVNAQLDQLNKYADDTVYSFQDMTSNIGKFTNVGVALEDATKSMMGIANITAYAGQGAQQASMAMYNLSQAMGMGYLGTMDWRSLENANITTVAFRDALIQAGVALGTLEKNGDKYYTKAEKGSKAIEVSSENIRETLSHKWATSDVMTTVFKIFSGELSAEEIAALGFEYNLNDPNSAAFYWERVGQEAKKSATEVRTLGKMMDALKEASQSGWANSMKLIFGDLKESTDLWTGLNDFFSKAIDRSAESRNAILQGWRGRIYDEMSGEWVQAEGAIDGRQIMIDALYDILDVGQSISNIFHSAFEAVFGKITSQTLLNLTMRIKSFTGNLKEVFSVLGGGASVGDKLQIIFSGILSVGKMFLNTFKKVGSFLGEVFAPIGDFFLNTFAKVGDWLQVFTNGDLIDFLRRIKTGFQSLTREKVSAWFVKVGDSAKTLFQKVTSSAGNWLRENNFGGVANWIVSAGDWIKGAWESVTSTLSQVWNGFVGSSFYQGIANTASNIWDSVYGFFTKKDETDHTGFDNFISDIVGFFTRVGEEVEAAWNGFTGSAFFKGVSDVASNIWDSILGFFTVKDESKKTGFDNFVGEITAFLTDLSGKVTDAWNEFTKSDFYTGLSDFVSSIFNKIVGFFTEEREGGKTGFNNFIEKMSGWFGQLGESLSQAWTSMTGTELNFDGVITTVGGWLNTVKTTVVDVWNEIYNWSGWDTLGQFFSDAWSWIANKLGLNGNSAGGTPTARIPGQIGLIAAGSASDVMSMKASAKQTADQVTETAGVLSSIFDPLTNLINAASSWPGWDTLGTVLTQIFDGITGLVQSVVDNSGITAAFEALGGVINLVLRIVNEIVSFGNRLLDGDGGAIAISVIAGIVKIALSVLQWKKYSSVIAKAGGVANDFGGEILKLSAGIWLISSAIGMLGNMDENSFTDGATRVIGIGLAVFALYSAFKEVSKFFSNETGAQDAPVKAWERLLTNVIKWIGIAGTAAVVMALLPNVISAFKDFDYKPGEFIDLFGGIAAMILALSAGIRIMSNVSIQGVISGILGIGVGIVGLSAALMLLSGIMDTSKLGRIDFKHILENVKTFMKGLADILGTFSGTLSGSKDATYMVKAAEGANESAEIAAQMNMEGFEKFKTSMEAITELTKSLPKDPDRLLGLAKFFTGDQSLSHFTSDLPTVADNIVQFSNAFDSEEFSPQGFENIENAIGYISRLVDMAETIAVIGEMTNGKAASVVLGQFLDTFHLYSGMFADLQEDAGEPIRGPSSTTFTSKMEELMKLGETFAATFNEGIKIAAETIDSTPLIQAIYDSLTSTNAKKTISAGFRIMSSYLQDEGLVEATEGGALDLTSVFNNMLGMLENVKLPEGGLFGGLLKKDENGNADVTSLLGFDPATIYNQYKDESGNMETYFTSGQEAMKKYIELLNSGVGEDGTHEVTLTPVWDESEMPSLFDTDGVIEIKGNVSLDEASIASIENGAKQVVTAVGQTTLAISALQSTVAGLGSRVDGVQSAVYSLGGRMDGVVSAIQALNIVVDVKQVSTAVDSTLGSTAGLKQRTGPVIAKPSFTPVSITDG